MEAWPFMACRDRRKLKRDVSARSMRHGRTDCLPAGPSRRLGSGLTATLSGRFTK